MIRFEFQGFIKRRDRGFMLSPVCQSYASIISLADAPPQWSQSISLYLCKSLQVCIVLYLFFKIDIRL